MALWDGIPYESVLREVILRKLGENSYTLEGISRAVTLNGKHPSVNDLRPQLERLEKRGAIVLDGEIYHLQKGVNYTKFL